MDWQGDGTVNGMPGGLQLVSLCEFAFYQLDKVSIWETLMALLKSMDL